MQSKDVVVKVRVSAAQLERWKAAAEQAREQAREVSWRDDPAEYDRLRALRWHRGQGDLSAFIRLTVDAAVDVQNRGHKTAGGNGATKAAAFSGRNRGHTGARARGDR